MLQVEDKFRLDLSDEEAVKYLQGLIDLSIRAIFPELFEKIHKIAQVSLILQLQSIIIFIRILGNNYSLLVLIMSVCMFIIKL